MNRLKGLTSILSEVPSDSKVLGFFKIKPTQSELIWKEKQDMCEEDKI